MCDACGPQHTSSNHQLLFYAHQYLKPLDRRRQYFADLFPEAQMGISIKGGIASMYLGNIMLLLFNIPMIALWVKILKVPYFVLYPLILLFCVVGVYTTNSNEVEIYILILFGGLGYVLRRLGFDLAPFIIALVLGPMLEENFRQALVLSGGKISVFFTRPISLAFLLVTLFLLSTYAFPIFKKQELTKKSG